MAGSANITERGSDGVAFEKPIPASQPGDTFPAGAVLLWAGSAAPVGWIICDGSAISRAGYPVLFTNISTTWGAGDGSTTFNIPDFRDRTPVGKSGTKALASTGGAETHAVSIAEMPSHSHGGVTDTQGSHSHVGSDGNNILVAQPLGGTGEFLGSTGVAVSRLSTNAAGAHAHTITAQGGGTAMSLMQPYAAINYIIRAY